MKVRCIGLLNAHGEPVRTSGWLTIGKEYLVLEVFVDEQGGSRFRIISDDADSAILALSSQFEAVSETIPKCWVVTFTANWLLFSPAAFQGDFWERYFDGDAAARNDLNEVVKLIENETR